MGDSQAYQPLLTVLASGIFPGKHRPVERSLAIWQVHAMLLRFLRRFVESYLTLFIVYAIYVLRKFDEQRAQA